MNSYEGAVFFVDILGFSALTKGQVQNITQKDYGAWGVDYNLEHPYSFLAATILVEFRDVLQQLKQKLPSLHIAQISDCAFIWCEDMTEFLKGVHLFMWTAVKDKGILCRGGISYGEIVEVENVDYALGAFVVGDAVTRAAKNEGRLKGPRITMDENFPHDVWTHAKNAHCIEYISHDLFNELQSEINMEKADEYRWYLCDADFIANQKNPPTYKDCVELTKKRLEIANVLKYHPRMGWNSRGEEGLTHLSAGEFSISRNSLLHVLHRFETQIVLNDDNRSIGNVEKANVRVKNDLYFSTEQEEEWRQSLADCD